MRILLSYTLVFFYGAIIGYFIGKASNIDIFKEEPKKPKGLDGHRWGKDEL